MTFLYAGGRSAVDVRLPSGRWVTASRGDEVEVEDAADAEALEALPDWLPVEPSPDPDLSEETTP